MLKKLGFTVTLKQNAKQQEMDESIREFGRELKRIRGVGLFFYAGHGIQIGGVNYLLPVNARIEKESDVRFHSVNADMVFAEMENAENGINIVILDACRDNPYSRSFRNAARGLAIVSNAPAGTFISYSTGANQVARDGEGKNSPYTKALLENIAKQGLTINDVFMNVRTKVKKETGQVPWELSSLEGRFYFAPHGGSQNSPSDAASSAPRPDSDEIVQQKAALEQERQELARQKALDAEQFAAERHKIETERQQLAKVQQPSVATASETGRDGHFIAYNNGTVLDTKTNLMWASNDNLANINWSDAKNYCGNYRGGGYTDWRMPTEAELADLYDRSKSYIASNQDYNVHLTSLIKLSGCCPWTSEAYGSNAALFYFGDGFRRSALQSLNNALGRALPVRSAKNEDLERKKQELAWDKQEIERQKALDVEREQLAAERRKVEAERQQLAMGQRPSVSTAGETSRDGRFIAYNNGTVSDTRTGLMWAAKDNGSNINWANAKSYCENYRGGGYTDWRLPTQDELAGLYEKGIGYTPVCAASGDNDKVRLTNLINLSCWAGWASWTRGSEAATFYFLTGTHNWSPRSSDFFRALPVRSGK
jgi:uncharacterized caspase-like protein